jgi:hypothetical protein
MLHLQFYYFVVHIAGMRHCKQNDVMTLSEILIMQWAMDCDQRIASTALQVPQAKGGLAGIPRIGSSDRISIRNTVFHIQSARTCPTEGTAIHLTILLCVPLFCFPYFDGLGPLICSSL